MNNGRNRRMVVSRHGGPEVLRMMEEALPEPASGEIRVRVSAAGVSAFDLIYRRWGRLPGSPDVPFTLGEDVVGVVDALGPSVSSLELGQTVAAGTWSLGVGGGYAEYVCLAAREAVPVPAGLDPAEAVCMVVNYLTAHLHLHRIAHAQPGERVLVHGAAGGVGTALLDLGRLAGLEMFATASAHNHDVVSSFGATAIDYREVDFVERIRFLTGDGVDLVVDPVGGGMQLWRSYRTLRRGGRLVWLGSAATNTSGLRVGPLSMVVAYLLKLVPDGRSVPRCPTVDTFIAAHHDWYRQTLTQLLDDLAAGRLAPVVADRVALGDASRAHALLERSGHAGKVVLVPGE